MKLEILQKEFSFAGIVPLGYKTYVLTPNYELVVDDEINTFTILERKFDRSYSETNPNGIKMENIKKALKDMNLI